MRERLWVALDVETLKEADSLLERLGGGASPLIGAKIGSQLFTAAGPAAVETAIKRGFPVFLDLKYHDIPNTVAGAVREATRMGVATLNVHASGGVAMMRAAAEAATAAAKDFGVPRPMCLGVTVLTSLDRRGLEEVGVIGSVEAHVLHLAERARSAGLDGCVASPQEIGLLRRALGPRWAIVTPGIRPADQSKQDQVRIATAAAAIGAGATAVVVGRPITAAPDPPAAAAAILREIAAALR
jgi:orotidine-5'-phosphate decarboxylase